MRTVAWVRSPVLSLSYLSLSLIPQAGWKPLFVAGSGGWRLEDGGWRMEDGGIGKEGLGGVETK